MSTKDKKMIKFDVVAYENDVVNDVEFLHNLSQAMSYENDLRTEETLPSTQQMILTQNDLTPPSSEKSTAVQDDYHLLDSLINESKDYFSDILWENELGRQPQQSKCESSSISVNSNFHSYGECNVLNTIANNLKNIPRENFEANELSPNSTLLQNGTNDSYNNTLTSKDNSTSIVTSVTNATVNNNADESEDTKLDSSEEKYAYLHALNSDNLMKLSQQSVLQEMMKEQMTIKPNINLLPTFEEHDQGGYNFHIKVNSSEPHIRGNKSNVVYSENLNKLYIRMNEHVYIDAHYTLKAPVQPLRIRAFMVFSKDVSEPVVRCQNHICKDDNGNMNIRHSLIRCQNSHVEYCGSETGKYIKDRYSIVIPMNACVKSQEDENEVKQQFLFSFSCNNSCIGRRETSAVFLLETMSGEILSQRLLHVKVCTCPRRDLRMDERSLNGSSPLKRKFKDDVEIHKNLNYGSSEGKIMKLTDTDNSRTSYEEHSDNSSSKYLQRVKMKTYNSDIFLDRDEIVINVRYKNLQEALDHIRMLHIQAISNERLFGRDYSHREMFEMLYAKALKLK